uniref:Cytochrome P450 CYP410a1 n=1 Tax=Dendroctonus ponderosae TaxID=77166 RepID=I1VJ29_DENPD|nr:cytochrome P450 CYP410a1 [Dendroctonus ponderosae]
MYFILITLLIFYTVFIFWKWRFIKFSWKNNAFFAPILPVIGTMYLPVMYGCTDVITATSYVGSKVGFPYNVWMIFDYYYFTKDPMDIKTVLHNLSAQNKASVYDDIAYLFPNSLLIAHYKDWRIRRKAYMKCFKPSTLKSYCSDYFQNALDKIDNMRKEKSDFAMSYDAFNRLTFKNFFTTSVGLNEEPGSLNIFADKLLEFEDDLAKKLVNPLIHVMLWYHLHPGGIRTANAIKTIRSIIKQILEKKMHQRADAKGDFHSEDNNAELPLLDLMTSLKESIISEKDLFNDMVFIAAAATDTTGHTLMMAFTFLGMFPDVQETLLEEITRVGSNITFDDLLKLSYTEAVINETLRLFPVVPFVGRVLDKDIDLGHKVIPRGTHFAASIFDLHRDNRYWPDPLKFNPNRFLPENISKVQPGTFIPFSTGPRDCIGKAQAMAMMKITIALIIRNFKIHSKHKSIEEFQYISGITMKTRQQPDCHFSLRQ